MTDRRPIPPPPPKPRTKRAKKNSCVVLTNPTLAMPTPRNKLTPKGEGFDPVLSTEDGITDWEAHAALDPDTPNLRRLGLMTAIDYDAAPLSEQAALRKVARENNMIHVGATVPTINTNRL